VGTIINDGGMSTRNVRQSNIELGKYLLNNKNKYCNHIISAFSNRLFSIRVTEIILFF